MLWATPLVTSARVSGRAPGSCCKHFSSASLNHLKAGTLAFLTFCLKTL